jgi:uncharacterized protein GlcG (DUF336 family)
VISGRSAYVAAGAPFARTRNSIMGITQAQADAAIGAARAAALAIGVSMNIAVYDDGANLKAFARMDGALLGSLDVAMGKARTAALFGFNTEALYDFCKPGGTSPGFENSNGGLVVFAGGIPVRDYEVIGPFNARMAKPLTPTVRGIYADGDMVITLFDGEGVTKDGQPYRNTYTWYFQMRDGVVTKAIAFFDVREFDDFWTRVSPTR